MPTKFLSVSGAVAFGIAVCSCGSEASNGQSADKTPPTEDGAMMGSGDGTEGSAQEDARNGVPADSPEDEAGDGDPGDFLDAVRSAQNSEMAPNPSETGPAIGPEENNGPLTPEEARLEGTEESIRPDGSSSEDMTEASSGEGEGAGATGSASEARYGSCDECRAAMCTETWEVCQAEPRCSSALGCLGAECSASDSLDCASACFDDDLELALAAFQLYACSLAQCRVECE